MRRLFRLCHKALDAASQFVCSKAHTCVLRLRLWLNGVSFGHGVNTWGGAVSLHISKDAGKVQIGDNVTFNSYDGPSYNCRCAIYVKQGAELTIGDGSGFNGALVYSAGCITIGKNVKIGGASMVFDTDFHPLDHEARREGFDGTQIRPVVIEDDVFVGARCIIGKGVTIGARSIVAAGSVVVKPIPPDELWGGNPAKFIRKIQSCKG